MNARMNNQLSQDEKLKRSMMKQYNIREEDLEIGQINEFQTDARNINTLNLNQIKPMPQSQNLQAQGQNGNFNTQEHVSQRTRYQTNKRSNREGQLLDEDVSKPDFDSTSTEPQREGAREQNKITDQQVPQYYPQFEPNYFDQYNRPQNDQGVIDPSVQQKLSQKQLESAMQYQKFDNQRSLLQKQKDMMENDAIRGQQKIDLEAKFEIIPEQETSLNGLTFYCNHSCFPEYKHIYLDYTISPYSRVQEYEHSIMMEKIVQSDDTVVCYLDGIDRLWEGKNISYRYTIKGSYLTYHTPQISRHYSQFKTSHIFFDTPRQFNSKAKNHYGDPDISKYFGCFFRQYIRGNFEHGCIENFEQLVIFWKNCYFSPQDFPLEKLIIQMNFDVQAAIQEGNYSIMKFCLEVLGFFLSKYEKQLQDHLREYGKTFLNTNIQQLDLINRYQLLDRNYSTKHQKRVSYIKKAIKLIGNLYLPFSLMFIMNQEIVPSIKETISFVEYSFVQQNFDHVQNIVLYWLKTLDEKFAEIKWDLCKLMVDCLKSLDQYLNVDEDILKRVNIQYIKNKISEISKNYPKDSVQLWIADNLGKILQKQTLASLLADEIVYCIQRNSKRQEFAQKYQYILKDHSHLLGPDSILNIAQTARTSEEIKNIGSLIISNLKNNRPMNFEQLALILITLFSNRIQVLDSLQMMVTSYSSHIGFQNALFAQISEMPDLKIDHLIQEQAKELLAVISKRFTTIDDLMKQLSQYFENLRNYQFEDIRPFSDVVLKLIIKFISNPEQFFRMLKIFPIKSQNQCLKTVAIDYWNNVMQTAEAIFASKLDLFLMIESKPLSEIIQTASSEAKLSIDFFREAALQNYKILIDANEKIAIYKRLANPNMETKVLDFFNSILYEEQFNTEQLQKIIAYIREFQELYENTNIFCKRLNGCENFIDIQTVEQILKDIQANEKGLALRVLIQNDRFKLIRQLKMPKFNRNLSDSLIYTNFIDQYLQQVGEDWHAQNNDEKISLFDLDIQMGQNLIKGQLRAHIERLMSYPDQELTYEELQHWIEFTSVQVTKELEIYENSIQLQTTFQHSIKFHQDLSRDLNIISQITDLKKESEQILKLRFLQNYSILGNNSQNFDFIEKFIDLTNNLQDSSFNLIVSQIKQVNQMLRSKPINYKILEEIQYCEELIKFCLANPQINFNELSDGLEDAELEDRCILTDMNLIKSFIEKLISTIQDRLKIDSFNSMLSSVSQLVQSTMSQDNSFQGRLRSCRTELENIRTICNTQLNTQENAIKVVTQIMQDGIALFQIIGEKCVLKISYGDGKEIENDKINTYCARAILTSHNKKSGNREQDSFSSLADSFSLKVKIIQDIKKVIQDLAQNGHLDFDNKFFKTINISDKSDEQLQQDLDMYKKIVEKWKSELNLIRQNNYYMSYIPNSKISQMANFLSGEGEVTTQISSLFAFINPDVNPEQARRHYRFSQQDKSMSEFVLDLGQKVQKIFQGQAQMLKHMRYNPELNEIKDKIIKAGDFKAFQVSNSLENIKAIASIFSVSKTWPRMSQLMFCTPRTKLYEIECFVLRAVLHNKNKAIKEEMVYVLSNFQKLSLSLQIETIKFIDNITAQEKQVKFQDFYLIILQTIDPKNPAPLVEEMQQKPSFSQYIVPDKFLSQFFACPNVTVVVSERAGLGKSRMIKDRIRDKNHTYINIPFQGDLSKQKICDIHEQRLQHIAEHQNVGFHYTINPSQGEDVNIILFELIMFGGINNGDQSIYIIPNEERLLKIELSQDIKQNHQENLFLYLIENQTNLKWDIKNLLVSNDPGSYSQLVLKSIKMKNKDSFNFQELQDHQITISNEEARQILHEEFLCNIEDPNYYLLDSYFAFAGDQFSQLIKSDFFNGGTFAIQFEKNASKYLNNFVKMILEFSKKICMKTKSMANQKLSLSQNKIGEIEEVKGMENVSWSFQQEAFITFNDDGTVTPIFREFNNLPQFMQSYYQEILNVFKQSRLVKNVEETKLEMTSFESLSEISPSKIIEKIFKICGRDFDAFTKLPKQSEGWFDAYRLAFTADNFLKMNFIFLRLRSRQLVTIMGETGVGKTALIEYLKDVMQWRYEKLNIHEGITEEKIIEFVNKADGIRHTRVILFFDEVNTNFNVSGLLKEIMLDRSVNGKPIGDHISIVAACNPYKLKLTKIEKRSFTSGIKHNRINQMSDNVVYKVHPLPESIFPFVQDYGALHLAEQEKYIQKIVERIRVEVRVGYSNEVIKFISKCVFASHEFINNKYSVSAVSLRDVDRFKKLYSYFYFNNIMQDGKRRDEYYSLDEQVVMKRVLVLALSVCYKLSFGTKQLRDEYDLLISNITSDGLNIKLSEMQLYLKAEQDRYIRNIEIPRGIGKNESLKENVFAIITMIMNKIPLFITGKPGSSKTLAMNLVSKSMKGKGSHSEFFKRFPALQLFNYQSSIQSTSAGIVRIFERGNGAYEKYIKKYNEEQPDKRTEVIFVVVIDEIGLAELSPHNPLKVLHAFLEEFKLGFVGISNWALDDSKRNRGINLSKPDPTIDDLRQSAESQIKEILEIPDESSQYGQENRSKRSGIAEQKFKKFKSEYLEKLVNFYSEYYKDQKIPNFHGLRDFYQLVCHFGQKLKSNQGDDLLAIYEGVQRNFGGQDVDVVLKHLMQSFPEYVKDDLERMTPATLISENLADPLARNLMVISDHQENMTLRYIEEICRHENRSYQIFYGSNFEKDKKEEAIYQIINDIILCMESGKIVILLNLENIYQAFYDMLNQNYQVVNGQKRCKVTIGPDSSRCIVHDEFKCILLVNSKQVKKMDAPLLNRFEKHTYNDYENLSPENKELINELIDWMKSVSSCTTPAGKFSSEDMFPVLTYDKKQLLNSLTTLILMAQNLVFQEESFDDQVKDFCKKQILSLSNQSGVIRSQLINSPDQEVLVQYYKDAECHTDIVSMIDNYSQYWFQDYFFNTNPQVENYENLGFDVCVYTYSSYIVGSQNLYEDYNIDPTPVLVDGILSKNEFEAKIKNYFSSHSQYTNLIIIADSLKNNTNTLSLCRSIINQCRNQYKIDNQNSMDESGNQELVQSKNIIFVIKIYGKYDANICFGPGWKETFIDLMNGKGHTQIEVDKFLNFNFDQLVKENRIFNYILDLSIPQIISTIKYPIIVKTQQNVDLMVLEADFRVQRVDILSSIVKKNIDLQNMMKDLFKRLIVQNDNINLKKVDWQIQAVCNREIMNQSSSFHAAAINFIKKLMSKNIGYVVYLLEEMSLIDSLHECIESDLGEQVKTLIDYFLEIFNSTYIHIPPKNNYIIKSMDKGNYPFFKYIIDKLELIKEISIAQTKQMDKNILHLLSKIEDQQDSINQDEKLIKSHENGDKEMEQDEYNLKSEQISNNKITVARDLQGIINQQNSRFQEIHRQLLQNFSKEDLQRGLLKFSSKRFISSLSYYLGKDVGFSFYENMFKLLLPETTLDCVQIYAVYLMYHSFIEQTYAIVKQFGNFINESHLFEELTRTFLFMQQQENQKIDESIKQLAMQGQIEEEQDDQEQKPIGVKTKYILYQAFIRVIYLMTLPSEQLEESLTRNSIQYEDFMQQILVNLEFYSCFKNTKEISMIQFLLRYQQKVINNIDDKNINELRDLAERIKNLDSPINKIEMVINLNDPYGYDSEDQDGERNRDEEQDQEQDQGEEQEGEEQKQEADEEAKAEEAEEQKQESEESDESDSDEDEPAEETLEEKKVRIVWEFIYSYLEDEFDQILDSDMDEYLDFCLKALSTNFEQLKKNPLLAHGIVRKIIQQAHRKDNQVFIQKAGLNYEELVQENSFIERFDEFLMELNVESPFTIIVCDIIGEVIQEQIEALNQSEEPLPDDLKIELLTGSMNASLKTTNPLLQRVIGAAMSRVLLNEAAARMLINFTMNQGVPLQNSLIAALHNYMANEQIGKVKPYIFYLFKVLIQHMDYDSLMEKLVPSLPWIFAIRTKELSERHMFKVFASSKVDHQTQIISHLSTNQASFKMTIDQAKQKYKLKLLTLQVVAQEFYLNKQRDRFQTYTYMLELLNNDVKGGVFYDMLCQGHDNYSNLRKRVLIGHQGLIGELVVYSIANFITLPENNIFRHLLNNPQQVANMFLPFIVNTRYDMQYFYYFRNNENFARYACVACGEYFLVGDCGALSNHRSANQQVNLGGTLCKCGQRVGFGAENNSRLIDRGKNKRNFDPEIDSQPGYISQDPEVYEMITNLRELNNITKQIGQILLHLVLLGAHLLSDENVQNEIQKIYAPDFQNAQNQTRAEYSQSFLVRIIQYNCRSLKELLNINDDRLKLLLEYMIQDISIKCQVKEFNDELGIEKLSTKEGRRALERHFQTKCQPKFEDNFVEFFQNNQEQNSNNNEEFKYNQEHIDETYHLKRQHNLSPQRNANMYHLLRVQGQITLRKFQQYLSSNQSNEGDFLLRIILQIQNLEIMSHLKQLLEWMKYFILKFDGKVSFEDSLNFDIKTIIERIIKDPRERKQSMESFEKFANSWTRITEFADIRDGCDEIIIPSMSETARFQLMCLTNEKRDQLGINYFYLIQYVANMQNSFLKGVSELEGFRFVENQLERPVPFTELKPYQIVGDSINEEDIIKELKQNSINSLYFGQGRNVEYNIAKLSEKLFNRLLKNKVSIETSETVVGFSYTFENLTNPYNQFVEIEDAIPQIRFNGQYQVIQRLRSFEDRYNLLKDLQVTLNFIQQTKGAKNMSLKLYMKNFKIQSNDEVDEGIELQHVLHFYEEVEQTLLNRLVMSASPIYQVELLDYEQEVISRIIEVNEEKLINSRDILGRFIVRQLCYSQNIPTSLQLFKYIFDEFNQYLFGVQVPIDCKEYTKSFKQSQIVTSNSFHAYQHLQRLALDKEFEEEEAKRRKEQMNKINRERAAAYSQAHFEENANDQNLFEQVVANAPMDNNLFFDEFNSSSDKLEEKKGKPKKLQDNKAKKADKSKFKGLGSLISKKK